MLIEARKITKNFGSVQALRDVSFGIEKGSTVGLLGPNGSGKTTTMRLVTGMIAPDAGVLDVEGKDPQKDGEAVRARCGVLTEQAAMYEELTGEENLIFFAALYGLNHADAVRRVHELAQLLNMKSYLANKAAGYSTGMKKRLCVARALINRPDILILDEPTSGLDPESAQSILRLIGELNSQEVTILLCTHNLAEAQKVCTDYIFLSHGNVIEQGGLDYLKKKYNHQEMLNVTVNGAVPEKYAAENGVLRIPIRSREDIPGILRELCACADVFDAHVEDYDLSDIYFKIRGEERA